MRITQISNCVLYDTFNVSLKSYHTMDGDLMLKCFEYIRTILLLLLLLQHLGKMTKNILIFVKKQVVSIASTRKCTLLDGLTI